MGDQNGDRGDQRQSGSRNQQSKQNGGRDQLGNQQGSRNIGIASNANTGLIQQQGGMILGRGPATNANRERLAADRRNRDAPPADEPNAEDGDNPEEEVEPREQREPAGIVAAGSRILGKNVNVGSNQQNRYGNGSFNGHSGSHNRYQNDNTTYVNIQNKIYITRSPEENPRVRKRNKPEGKGKNSRGSKSARISIHDVPVAVASTSKAVNSQNLPGRIFDTIWDDFDKLQDQGKKGLRARCKACRAVVVGATQRMKHHKEYKCSNKTECKETVEKASSADGIESEACERDERSTADKELNAAVAQFFSENKIPFTAADSHSFKNMMSVARPGCVPPESDSLAAVLLED